MAAVDKAMDQTAPLDPNELFAESRALSVRKKGEVKFRIHPVIFKATCEEAAGGQVIQI